jgi:hypothetical protein
MLTKKIELKAIDLPIGWDPSVGSFASELLMRKAQQRLGVNGPAEIKAHPWLSSIDWSVLRSKKLKAPFIPSV